MDCRRCRDPELGPELRAQWGCDQPHREHVLKLKPCPFCRHGDPSCTACKGTDEYPIRRCPNATVTMQHVELVRAAVLVEQHGVLPDAGGLCDQAATFVAALPHLQRELRVYEAEAIKAASNKGR